MITVNITSKESRRYRARRRALCLRDKLPQIRNLRVFKGRHQTNADRGSFYKIPDGHSAKVPGSQARGDEGHQACVRCGMLGQVRGQRKAFMRKTGGIPRVSVI